MFRFFSFWKSVTFLLSDNTTRESFFFYLRTVKKKKKKKKKNEEEMTTIQTIQATTTLFPGERIRLDVDDDEEEAFECGSGAYRDENGIARASKIGAVCVKDIELEDDDDDDDEEEDEKTNEKTTKRRARKKLVEVLSAAEREDERSRVRLPEVNDVVFAKCVKIRDKMAQFDVLVCDGKPLKTDFSGIVRLQDVRKTEIDKVVIEESFVPGDVVRCKVLSMGDGRSLVLATNENTLGVVRAKCKRCKATMVAMNWQEMMCPKTEHREFRKVAKIDEITDI